MTGTSDRPQAPADSLRLVLQLLLGNVPHAPAPPAKPGRHRPAHNRSATAKQGWHSDSLFAETTSIDSGPPTSDISMVAFGGQSAAAIEIEPGICRLRRGTAFLASGDEYHPVLHVGVLTQTDWDRLVEEWINDPGLAIDIAAGVLPDELFTPRPVAATAFDPAERMAAVSHIIPTVDEIGVECDCGSTARACRHLRELAAALVAAVDEDAWTLIALRGCTPDEIVGRATAHLGFQPDAGQPRFVDAAELWADGAFGCEPPDDDVSPPETIDPRMFELPTPPPDSGLDGRDIAAAAYDAARRASAALRGQVVGSLSEHEKLVDLLAGRCAPHVPLALRPDFDEIQTATGVDATELVADVNAWLIGGAEALRACQVAWDPDPQIMHDAAALTNGLARARRNRLTTRDGRLQFRLTPEGSWFVFEVDDAIGWSIADGPEPSLAVLLDAYMNQRGGGATPRG